MFLHTALQKESWLCFVGGMWLSVYSHWWSASSKYTSMHKQLSSWLQWEVRSFVKAWSPISCPLEWEHVYCESGKLNLAPRDLLPYRPLLILL